MTCCSCGKDKIETKFNWKIYDKRRRTICRQCSKSYAKTHYENNKSVYKKRASDFKNKTRKQNRIFLVDYLSDKKCADCGNDNSVVFEFHHDNGEKYKNVGELMKNGTSWPTIRKEIDKCTILCANCHRIRTAQERGWFKGTQTKFKD